MEVQHTFDKLDDVLNIKLPQKTAQVCLQIERYGKTVANQVDGKDQILEIVSLCVDNVPVPCYILDKHSKFEFNNQCHLGSRYFSPNGVWTFDFQVPFITWALDQKIQHESQYNQDYLYPWSYKLGPDSVKNLQRQLGQVEKLANEKL